MAHRHGRINKSEAMTDADRAISDSGREEEQPARLCYADLLTNRQIVHFWRRVNISDGCWNWCGRISNSGYGQFSWLSHVGRLNGYSHRISWELLRERIPDGLTIDHLCRNKHCVNPAHLEPVTGRVNNLRGDNPPAQNARRTHCKYGHEFSGDNLWVNSHGYRTCRACKRRLRAKYLR